VSAFLDSKITLLFLSGLAAVAMGCSAEGSSLDAGSSEADARRQTPRPDAEPFNFPDAMPGAPDAAPGCPDPNEPNETAGGATSLSADPISDNDGSGGSFTGAAQDADEDWFTYLGSDDLGNTVDPTVGITSGAVEVCMFLDCQAGNTTFSCPGGTTSTDVGGIAGCCGTAGFTVDDLNCPGISDDADVYIRVKASAGGVCEAYSLTYHY
jgi:hypothetical protein